jgi:hypothetical protein
METDRQPTITVRVPPPANGSTTDLSTASRSFTVFASEVASHPLALTNPTMTVRVRHDLATGKAEPITVDWENAPKDSWVYLATRLRPLMFNQSDPTYMPRLVNRIEKEHLPLRGVLTPYRELFRDWDAARNLLVSKEGTLPADFPADGTGTIRLGPTGALPPDLADVAWVDDKELADIVFNGHLWHSDTGKARVFLDASDLEKATMMKAAELRTISAVPAVLKLAQFLEFARSVGYAL